MIDKNLSARITFNVIHSEMEILVRKKCHEVHDLLQRKFIYKLYFVCLIVSALVCPTRLTSEAQ